MHQRENTVSTKLEHTKMGEAVFIGALADLAKGLVQLMATRALNEINPGLGFKDQLRKLNKKFEYIQAFLEDAGNSKYALKSRLVNLLVQKVKDVAYLADDVMDEYAIETFRRKMKLKNRTKFRNFFTLSNTIFFRFRMAHKVSEILSLFDEIDKDAKDIGLNQVDVATTSLTYTYTLGQNLETRQYAVPEASEFIGREDDQAELLDVICSPFMEERNLSTVAVVGMGGIGKTTSARHLYDNQEVCAHFAKKIWICVSDNFKVTSLLNEMVESVTSSKSDLSNSDAIIRRLQEELKGNKLLLVLDDVWEDSEQLWGSLKGLLHIIQIALGSVVLITTRSNKVADAAGAIFKHKLEGLSDEKSWSLLCQIVSDNNNVQINPNLEEVGKRIVKKCQGVPLAIKVLGGLLRSKHYLHEWESIEKSHLWDMPEGQHLIFPSLMLSFNHLPSPSVKQLFAYCAVIPKGHHVYRSELIGLWLSQGYLCNDKRSNLTAEEIGEEYLEILLSSSLLECVSTEFGSVGYMMHDLVYDLAVYVCGDDLIREAKKLCEESHCRHLVINFGENKSIPNFPSEKALTKLRTLDLKGMVIPWNILVHTRYLRTLLIDRTGITEVPPAISLLKHLRYLDVSYNPISTLPDSICKLYQLQTLILQGCTNMVKLPKVLNKLVNLRHISTTAPMFAWRGLRQLTNLQSLPALSLNDDGEGWTIDELGDLHKLRDEVRIMGLEHIKDKETTRKVRLDRKANVTKLTLSWMERREETGEGDCDEDVLEGLEPHPNITSLEVLNFIGNRFPTWITKMAVLTEGPSGKRTQLDNLTMVKLLNCSRCQTLPNLGQLPVLLYLTLSELDLEIIGPEFYGGDHLGIHEVISFKCLRELEISGFRRLVTWRDPPEGAFPSLETLCIKDCRRLKSVPALKLKSLTSLQLENLNKVESLDVIRYSLGLSSLIMDTLPKIENLPQELANCRKLRTLQICNFGKLTSLPTGLESLINLQSLVVASCASLNLVMDDALHVRSSLHSFEIVNCPRLKMIPRNLEECTMLVTLSILDCPIIEGSWTYISKLRQLMELRMSFRSAEHMRSVIEAAKHLPNLLQLELEGFRDDEEMREYFSDMNLFLRLPSLRELMFQGRPNIKTLPQQLGLLTRITALFIWNFNGLEEISTWICNISSLRYLIIEDCKNLNKLPWKQELQRLLLIYLRITRCPCLVERYAKDEGSEWHNISHISKIVIDGETIQDLG